MATTPTSPTDPSFVDLTAPNPGIMPGYAPFKDAPGPDPVTIGSLTFNSVEAPSVLPIGAFTADVVVNKRIGSGQHTANMGVHPDPVSITGRFVQPNVDAHVALLTAMINARQEVPFTWRTQRFYCYVKNVVPKYRHANYCDYDVTVTITRPNNGAVAQAAPTSVNSQIANLAANAAGQNASITGVDPTGASSFQQALQTALTYIQLAGPIAQLAAPQLSTLIQSVTGAASAVQNYQNSIAEGAPQYVAAGQLVTSLSLIAQYAQTGQSAQTVRVQGASMFELAAQYYGDVTLFSQLQSANNAVSPYTSSQVYKDVGLPPIQSTTQGQITPTASGV